MTNPAFTQHAFQRYIAEGKLMGSRNRQTGELFVPPRALDPTTYGDDMEWVELSGKGQLTAFTVVTIGPASMIAAGYNRQNPYCSGIVELAEGPRISAQIVGVDVQHPEQIAIGTELEMVLVERNGAKALGFQPV